MSLDPRFLALIEDRKSRWNEMPDSFRQERYVDISCAAEEYDFEQWIQNYRYTDQNKYLNERHN
jgi:hypothetical protein